MGSVLLTQCFLNRARELRNIMEGILGKVLMRWGVHCRHLYSWSVCVQGACDTFGMLLLLIASVTPLWFRHEYHSGLTSAYLSQILGIIPIQTSGICLPNIFIAQSEITLIQRIVSQSFNYQLIKHWCLFCVKGESLPLLLHQLPELQSAGPLKGLFSSLHCSVFHRP